MPSAFKKVLLLQHMRPSVHGPSTPVCSPLVAAIGERHASHNLLPPGAFFVRATLDLQGHPSSAPSFYVILGLPAVALLSEILLSKPLWTNLDANAAAAPFQTKPGAPSLVPRLIQLRLLLRPAPRFRPLKLACRTPPLGGR
jgi:hypothetical protein